MTTDISDQELSDQELSDQELSDQELSDQEYRAAEHRNAQHRAVGLSDAIDPAIANALLAQRPYAYAITDRHLCIQRTGGSDGLWADEYRRPGSRLGGALWELAPELYPHQAELRALLAGDLPRFEIPMVQRGERADVGPYVTLINVPYRNDAGQIVGVLLCAEEITNTVLTQQHMTQQRNELSVLRDQLAQQNEELSAANAELERLDQMKSIFVSTAAHELRSPVSAIFGYTELLRDAETGPLNAEQQQYLDVVERNAKRLLALGSNLLDITRLEMGHLTLAVRATDLLTLAESAAEQIQPAIDAKKQQFVLDASPGLSRALCDPTRTLQVLTNLLSNASKYTPEGGSISLRLASEHPQGPVQIAVEDTGIGIPQEEHDRLFERFFRASNVSETDSSGVGLGLYIVKMLVELQDGEIWFESERGRGTVFYVTLPRDSEASNAGGDQNRSESDDLIGLNESPLF